jgi:hypothetical protein
LAGNLEVGFDLCRWGKDLDIWCRDLHRRDSDLWDVNWGYFISLLLDNFDLLWDLIMNLKLLGWWKKFNIWAWNSNWWWLGNIQALNHWLDRVYWNWWWWRWHVDSWLFLDIDLLWRWGWLDDYLLNNWLLNILDLLDNWLLYNLNRLLNNLNRLLDDLGWCLDDNLRGSQRGNLAKGSVPELSSDESATALKNVWDSVPIDIDT